MLLPTGAEYTAHDSPAPTSTPGASTPLCPLIPLGLPPSPFREKANAAPVDSAQATLDLHRRSRMRIPRSDSDYIRSHTIHRRAPHHADEKQTTAVLAGVLGGFGVLCVVGCVIWVVRGRRMRRAREERRRARERKKAEAERKGGTEMKLSRNRSGEGEAKGVVGVSNPPPKPRFEEQGGVAARPSGDGKPSSASAEHLRGPPAKRNPSTVPSPLSRETHLPLSPQAHPRATPHSTPQAPREKLLPQAKQPPRPRPQEFEVPRLPKDDSAGRPETPTMPMHPPLAFSDSPTTNTVGGALDSNHMPSPSRYRHPRRHVGAAAPGDSAKAQEASDTEYFSDASTAATRQTLTNIGDRGGMGNSPRTNRSPRVQVQQTLVLDHPPAYTPDPS